jgi:hypothetical protein
MKWKIIYSGFWILAFPAAHFLLSMIMFAVVGWFDLLPPEPPTTAIGRVAFGSVVRIWTWSFWAAPLIALFLSFHGVLPGTKRYAGPETGE